jgi:hypothetical protein
MDGIIKQHTELRYNRLNSPPPLQGHASRIKAARAAAQSTAASTTEAAKATGAAAQSTAASTTEAAKATGAAAQTTTAT